MRTFEGYLDLRAGKPGEWVLLSPLSFGEYTVPAGFTTDLASIPRTVRPLVDRNGSSRAASVLHDWLYATRPVSRKEADALFLEALEASGVGWVRYAMYCGVRAGGWVFWK